MSGNCTSGIERCPACGNETFRITTYPAETASVWCEECENRVLLADLREASVDSRWYVDTGNEQEADQ